MFYLGINALNHDSSIALIDPESKSIIYAAHAERFSKEKNDSLLHPKLLDDIGIFPISRIFWHGNPYIKATRQWFSGKWQSEKPRKYLEQFKLLSKTPVTYVGHHHSHAAAGYFTSGFSDAVVVVADAIGDWSTLTVWKGEGNHLRKLRTFNYPSSIGLLYSAFTQRVGLKPNEEEYILMGMAAYGKPSYYEKIMEEFIDSKSDIWSVKKNVHIGIDDWMSGADHFDLAASIQLVTEKFLEKVFIYASKFSDKLVYQGGVALNCVANKYAYDTFNDVWIMPAPGDAGGAIGAVTSHVGHIKWDGPYLGHEIDGKYPVKEIYNELKKNKIVGVAKGKAEFGPRAFGNRSLFADPRGPEIKDKVNKIKKRQAFRPFAPVILEECLHDYFEVPNGVKSLPYMQLTVRCKRPDLFPAIVHVDGTSRVQTVNQKQHPDLYHLLRIFHYEELCPMILNTSLNIKGKPLVNDKRDAMEFENKYGCKVL